MKKTLLWVVLIAIAAVTFSVVASSGFVQKTLLYEDIKIMLDGREIKPADVNGNYIEPFIIEGTTYLPVRGIASSLGLDVGWDGETSTVILDDKKPDVKAMLYDENGIRVAYNGYSDDVEEPYLVLFLQNDTDKDVSVKVYDISQNGKKTDHKYNYIAFAGKRSEVLVPLENSGEVSFAIAVLDEKTQKYICEDIRVEADSEKAELVLNKITDFEFEGEATLDTLAEFLKANHQYIINNDIYGINISISDVDIFKVGTVKIKYSVAMKEFIVEAFTIADVYDHVNDQTVTVPVIMEIRINEGKKERKYYMDIVFDHRVSMKSIKMINTADNTVKKEKNRYVEDGEIIGNKYNTMEALDGMDVLAKDMTNTIIEMIISEGNKFLGEKVPGLSLDVLDLDKTEAEKQ